MKNDIRASRITIRPERVGDYAAIAAVNAAAFEGRAAEAAAVALLRQGPRFDPALSLVAEVDGRVAGHVLFTPYRVQLLGRAVPAVNLAPIAVEPAYQGRGLGRRLVEAGHAAARERGFAFSFLVGHPAYYPRFGYRPHAYGAATLTLAPAAAPPGEPLTAQPLQAADVPALHALWQAAEAEVDFALDPGEASLDWLSPNPAITAMVYRRSERVVAYARRHQDEPRRPRAFLADSADTTRAVSALLAAAEGGGEVVLPVHPASAAAQGLGASVTAWQAGMVHSLAPSPLDDYLAAVQAGRRPPGSVVWPVAFDLA